MRGYLPTVDGLRAVAVTAVLVFHLRSSWLPGGFVGVDVFFVISGYLITQPPVAPAEASRESIREGAAGPFAEDSQSAAERASAHQSLLELQKEGIEIVDIESLFTEGDGSVRILDDEGRFLYQDRSHLTSDGAQLVLDQIRALGIL